MYSAALSSTRPKVSEGNGLLISPQSILSLVTAVSTMNLSAGERPVRSPVSATRAPLSESVASPRRMDSSTSRAGERFSRTDLRSRSPRRSSILLRNVVSMPHHPFCTPSIFASGIIDDAAGPHPRPVNHFAGRLRLRFREGEEVLLDCFAGYFRVLPDLGSAGYVQSFPLGDPDDPVVHDELQGLGYLVEAEVAPRWIIQDLLPRAELGRQLFGRPLGGDVEVEGVLPGGPVGDNDPVAAQLRHDAAVTLEVVGDRVGEGGAVIGEPGTELGVVGLVVRRYLLPEQFEILEAQLLKPHRYTSSALGGPW